MMKRIMIAHANVCQYHLTLYAEFSLETLTRTKGIHLLKNIDLA